MARPKKGVVPPQLRAFVKKKKAGASKTKTKKANPFAKMKKTRGKKK